jgi:outer membrane cobalamin receptor
VAPNGKRFYVGRRTDLQTLSLVCVDEHNFGKFSIDGGVRWSKTYINEYGAFNIGGSPKGFKNVSPITDIWEPAIVNVSLGSNYYLSTLLSLYMNLSNGQIQPRRGSLDIDLEEPETENRTKLDLGIQVDLQKYGQFTMTGFYVNQDNAIVLSGKTRDFDDRILELYLNRDQDQVGVEGDFRFTGFSRHANFFLNAVIMNSRYAEGDEMVENNEIPDVILSGGIYANISRFDFNFFLKYISDYKSTRFVGSVQGQPPAPQPLGDFISINSTLGWSIGPSKNTRLYIDIQNLTDNAYSTVVGYPDFGRQIQFGISHHYR